MSLPYFELLQSEGITAWLRMMNMHERVLRLRGDGWSPDLISTSYAVPMDLILRIETAGPLPLESTDGSS